MTDKNSPKVARIFKCIYCHYICRKLSDYNKHLITRKHITTYNQLTNTDAMAKTIAKYECTCGNSYKHRQSLHNHKKKCSIAQGTNTQNMVIDNTTENNKSSGNDIDKEMLVKMLLKNQEVMEKMIEMISLIRNRSGM